MLDFILLIPCYNDENGLIESIKSVCYPAEKFQILIIDDGSILPINRNNLQQYFPELTIEIIRIAKNKGILNALNTGLVHLKKKSDYKYIARIDAADICATERFTKQVNFLNNNSTVFLLGSWCIFKNDSDGKEYKYVAKTKHEDIVKEMHYKCAFIHPSVMFRREVIDEVGLYPEGYPHAEDYAFFWEIIRKYITAILPEYLVTVHVHSKTISSENYRNQLQSRKNVVKFYGTNSYSKLIGSLLLWGKLLLPSSFIKWLKYNG